MGELDVFPMAHGGYGAAPNVIGGWLVTSWPGGRIDPITGRPGNHGGIDLVRAGATLGAPFYAVKPGRVSQGWDSGGGGNWTSLFCDDGDYIGYGHAQSFAPGVSGTHVEAGALLGYIDSTGSSTGSHMHYATRFAGAGAYGDPTDVLRRCADAGRFVGTQQAAEATAQVVAETIKEVAMARHIKNIDGHQIYVTPELQTFVVTDQGRRALLELDLVEKLPNGDEWDESTDVVLNTFRPIIASGATKLFGAP